MRLKPALATVLKCFDRAAPVTKPGMTVEISVILFHMMSDFSLQFQEVGSKFQLVTNRSKDLLKSFIS